MTVRRSSRLNNYFIPVDVEDNRRASVLGLAPLVTSFRGSGQYFSSCFPVLGIGDLLILVDQVLRAVRLPGNRKLWL